MIFSRWKVPADQRLRIYNSLIATGKIVFQLFQLFLKGKVKRIPDDGILCEYMNRTHIIFFNILFYHGFL